MYRLYNRENLLPHIIVHGKKSATTTEGAKLPSDGIEASMINFTRCLQKFISYISIRQQLLRVANQEPKMQVLVSLLTEKYITTATTLKNMFADTLIDACGKLNGNWSHTDLHSGRSGI